MQRARWGVSEKYKAYNNVRLQVGKSLLDMDGAVQFLNTQDELIGTMRDRISTQSSEIAELRETVAVLRGAFTKEEIVLLVAQTTNRRTGTEETRARSRRILKAMGVEVPESSGNPGPLKKARSK